MTSESRCLQLLHEKGFTDQYQVKEEKLINLTNDKSYAPKDVRVTNFYRFEGISNPDDMSVIYAIEATDGSRGTLIDAYGVYSDPSVAVFIKAVEDIEKKSRGWQ